jgi:recombination protein RecT
MTRSAPPTISQPAKGPRDQLKTGLEQMRGQFRLLLPSHIAVEKFERVVLTAVNVNPELAAADRRSFFNACVRTAQDGLLPDGREGALVIYKNRDGQKLVQWLPMVFGLIKKIRQSGEIDSVGARIVYQNEIDDKRFRFVVEDGIEKLYHDPMLWGARGDMVLTYAYARFKSGLIEYAPLHKDDVMKRKAVSRAQKGPWQEWEREMWLKTAIRALAPKLPLSAEILQSITRNEEPTEFDRLKHEAIAALGAPSEAPQEQGESAYVMEPLHADDAARIGFDTDAFLARAIEGLGEPEMQNRDELKNFATIIAESIRTLDDVSASRKQRMLDAFDAAYQEQSRKL